MLEFLKNFLRGKGEHKSESEGAPVVPPAPKPKVNSAKINKTRPPAVQTTYDTPAVRKLGVTFMEQYVAQYTSQASSRVKLIDLPIWKTIQSRSFEDKINLCLWAYRGKWEHTDTETDILVGKSYNASAAKDKLGGALMRSKLPYSEVQLIELVKICLSRPSLDWGNPVKSVLSHVERQLDGGVPSRGLNDVLTKLLKSCQQNLEYTDTENRRKIKQRVEAILNPQLASKPYALPKGDWARLVNTDINDLGAELAAKWRDLFEYAATANGSKPSQKWLKIGAEKIETVGVDDFQSKLADWMAKTRIDPVKPDAAVDVIKGLVWLTVNHPTENITLAVGRFAESCYVKITNYGARSKKLGNACFAALMMMPDNPTAVAQLVRLREKIKYPSVRKLIEKRLLEVARKKGLTVAELEDESLPNFGFDLSGRRIEAFGNYVATLTLDGAKAELSWADKAGKGRKAVPAAVKTDFKTEVKALKQLTKDITAVLAGQVRTLDQSYVTDRSWPFGAWAEQYLDHPLRAQITKSLIWEITEGVKTISIMATESGLEDISGQLHEFPDTAQVRLWHPLNGETADVLAWRAKIEELGFVQPFKQAHREIYVVTDAERRTDIYSNRFAAHILRQHQFKALCGARSWSYTLQGMWDSWNIPTKTIPAHNITVEFAVEMVADAEQTGAGIPLYLASDQVRFRQNQGQMRMENIPPIIFSEVMRDVDLFVAVTSVANDPSWADGGPDGRFGTYWQEYAFGDLGETAKTRRDIISKLVPKLAFADKLEVGLKVLKVQGTRHEYHIHFGSGNIMIMPGNKYLCIVRGPKVKKEDKIYLPFAGDTIVSIIMSKAQMLIHDDKITDRTILTQL